MKLKLVGLAILVAGMLMACASGLPQGTIMTGTVERTYTAAEVKRDRPEKFQRYLELGIAKETETDGTSEIAIQLFRGMFAGSGVWQYAYVPTELRGQVERGDFVQIKLVEDGTTKSIVNVLTRVVQKRDQKGPCKWVGGVVADDMVYCNGKKATVIRPEDQDKRTDVVLPKD